ncbi:MAG: 4Fe-4S binding protein [Actinobacteria bacterium]|nr:4Fe-4S binding protein [Actinomycetota bacterium]
MKQTIVDYGRCKHCAKCVARNACKTKALFQIDPEEPPAVDTKLCYGCGKCVLECPSEALTVKDL